VVQWFSSPFARAGFDKRRGWIFALQKEKLDGAKVFGDALLRTCSIGVTPIASGEPCARWP
jgi:hypothetical protein